MQDDNHDTESPTSTLIESDSPRIPNLPITICSSADVSSTCFKPGMGLPIELWIYIISFLAWDPLSLLACALTCKRLHSPADYMLGKFNNLQIDPTKYIDIDRLVEEVTILPRNAKCIHYLGVGQWFENSSESPPAIALSVIPRRLPGRIFKLSLLDISFIDNKTHCHPSTWALYGRVFRTVTNLTLRLVEFPSFMDFAYLITSFPVLTGLSLSEISCRNREIPPSITRSPRRRTLKLNYLGLCRMFTQAHEWVLTAFVPWFLRRAGQVPTEILIDQSIVIHPLSGGLLLRDTIREHLQHLSLCLLPVSEPIEDDSEDDVKLRWWMGE